MARLAGAGTGSLSAGLGSARPLPHRLEPVADHQGVIWVNDSKATNVAATRSALTSLNRPVVLLLGGKDKGEDFGQLAEAVRESARVVIGYGAAGPRAIEELSAALGIEAGAESDQVDRAGRTPVLCRVEGSLETVVAHAHFVAQSGDAVLLSPACSSFDMYESYGHRGRHFTRLARAVA